MKNIDTFIDLLTQVLKQTPVGETREAESDDSKLSVSKFDDGFSVKMTSGVKPTFKFNDSEIKRKASEFKSIIEDLDEDFWLQIVDTLSKTFNMSEFGHLLDQTEFTELEAHQLDEYIKDASKVIASILLDEQETIKSLYNRLANL